MKRFVVAALACASLFAATAQAGLFFDKIEFIPLAEQDAPALQGKTVAVTFHERPGFEPGPLNAYAAALPIDGAKDIADPGVLVREMLANQLLATHGMRVQPVDATPTKETKTAKLAALHPETDYVFDVATLNWSFGGFGGGGRKGLFLEYRARVRLIETSTKRALVDTQCLLSTFNHKDRPLRKMYEFNDAQLAKDVFASLAWQCTEMLAGQGLRVPAAAMPPRPETLVDPIGAFMKPRPAAAPAAK